jgi:hypothetical protein
MGQLGRAGQPQLLHPTATRSMSTALGSGRRQPPVASQPAISTLGRDFSAAGFCRSLGPRFFADERVGIAEFDGGLLREQAEVRVFDWFPSDFDKNGGV